MAKKHAKRNLVNGYWEPCMRASGRMEWICECGTGHGDHDHGCCSKECCRREDYPGKRGTADPSNVEGEFEAEEHTVSDVRINLLPALVDLVDALDGVAGCDLAKAKEQADRAIQQHVDAAT